MATFGLTNKQRDNYYSFETRRVLENLVDVVELSIFELDDTLVKKVSIPFGELLQDNYENYTGVVKVNVGQHLRNQGIHQGDYRVEYKFIKKVAGDYQRQFLIEISNGQLYSEDLPFGTFSDETTQEVKLFVTDEEGNFDFERELKFFSSGYEIFEISGDRTEVILQPDQKLPENIRSILDFSLDTFDQSTYYIPPRQPGLIAGLKFSETTINENYILQLPENKFDGFTEDLLNKKIVFENFFEAEIPTHTKGYYLPNWKSEWGVRLNGVNPKNPSVFIIPEDYQITDEMFSRVEDKLPTTIPFAKDNAEFTITQLSESEISEDAGLYVKDIDKEFNLRSFTTLPREIWQTNNLGPKSGGKRHYEYAGVYPYKYNKQEDTDNIDYNGSLRDDGEAGLSESDLGKNWFGYREDNLAKVFIDWETEIVQVIDRRTIVVKSNLKNIYYDLREQGFRITKICDIDYNKPKLIEGLDLSNSEWNKLYVSDERNDIQDFTSYLRTPNDYYLITNKKRVVDGMAFKLQKPLLNNVITLDDVDEEVNDPTLVTLVQEQLQDYNDNVTLIPRQVVNDTFLLPANFDGKQNTIQTRQTDYKSHDNLLGSDDEHNRKLERLLVSGSLLDVQPNIDYQKTTTDLTIERDDTGFGNFVHFSSAERRLNNFKTKLELIEGYTSDSSSLVSVSSSLSKIQSIEKKRQRVIDSFTPYEDFLYFESSSYSSGSNGQFHDTSWPKTNSSTPYILEHSSGSTATTWYNNMILSASDYDFNNQNSLRNTLPEHVNQDPSNNPFLEFMDMVGEQFDETWTYIKTLTDVNFRVNNVSEGISKDVSKYYADALGVKLFNGNDLVDLSEYLLGKNTDGTDKNESAGEALTEEIWKRVLTNLPFFIKTKGTERALKGILNCYGIPSSVLRVREFGGPDKGTRVSYEIKRKFTRALDFKAGQYIKVPWIYDTTNRTPQSIEFRFRTPHKSDQTIFKKGNGFAIQLINSGSTNYGYVRFAVSSSTGVSHLDTPKLKLFNDEMWSVLWKRNKSDGTTIGTGIAASASIDYELIAKQYDSTRQRIIYQQSSSLTVDGTSAKSASYNTKVGTEVGSNTFIGRATNWGGSQFSGSLMEFRLWSEPLSQSVFDNHVRTPKAYNGNSTSSAYDNLLLRLPLDDNRNLQTSPTASNISYIKTYSGNITGSNINGFTGNFYRSLVDQEKIKIPNVGIRRNATKIRLESNSLPENTQLSPVQKQEQSSQDFAPVDSEKLGVYFSPTDVINEDIIYTLADFNLDNQIGDPRDEFKPTYRGLHFTRNEYFKRYVGGHNNFFDYLRILDFYDDSVFEVLKQFVPARAKADFGNLIEPNLLERNKQITNRNIETTQPYYENANDYQVGLKISRFISGSDDNRITLGGTFPYYESVIAYATASIYRGSTFPTLVHLNKLNPRDPDNATYATASVTRGGTSIEFTEAVQPFISGSRLSQFNKVREFYFTSSLSVSTANGFGEDYKVPGGTQGVYVYSSSLEPTDLERSSVDSLSDKLFYLGTQLNRNTDESGQDPVSITFTSPTTLVTQQPGESRLKTD